MRYEVHFDDVQLTSDGGTTVLVTVAVNDAVTPPVRNTISIDVYDNACKAKLATLTGAESNAGDINDDCVTDVRDFGLVSAAWLINTELDEPYTDPLDAGHNRVGPNTVEVNAGKDIITWSGVPVTMDPTIVDDYDPNIPDDLKYYLWTYTPLAGVTVEFDSNSIPTPTVTITKELVYNLFVLNGSFEDPVLADSARVNVGTVPSWKSAWSTPGSGVWGDHNDRGGAYNPPVSEYITIPDGNNVGWATIDTSSDHCVYQELLITLQPSTAYVLSAKVGNPSNAPTANYRVELVAGDILSLSGVILASASGASPNGTTDPNWFDVSIPYTSVADPNEGQTLGVRLIAEVTVGDSLDLNFDAVVLLVDGEDGEDSYGPEPTRVELKLAVNKTGSSWNDVVSPVGIDVYNDACAAKGGTSESYDKTDLDSNCITSVTDIAEMVESWLDDIGALTEPVVKP
jgi:hypothetical protein